MGPSKKNPSLFWPLLGSVIILLLLGLFFVFEASTAESFLTYGHQYHFLQRQAVWAGVGLMVMLLISKIPLSWWQRLTPIGYFASLGLLVCPFIPGLGLTLNGASRWINLGFTVFQPIELLKLTMILFFAQWLSNHQRLGPFIFFTAIPAALLMLQPDLGSTLMVGMIGFGLFFVAGGEIKKILVVVGAAVLILLVLIFSSPYRRQRVVTYFNPDSDPQGSSFHIRQIILALGSGGWLGQGIGNSNQKYAYIPEASSDSIFAIVAEEVGFVGSTLIIWVFGGYFYVIYQLARQQPAGSYRSLLVAGILIWLSGQLAINLAAVVALIPLTGLPLPFFSYGGSALMMILVANGLLLRVANEKIPVR